MDEEQPASLPEPPAQFDEYRVLRSLGKGRSGEVFLAQDGVLDRPITLRFFTDGTATLDPEVKARFVAGAQAISRLQHPNLGSVLRVGEVEGRAFIAADYVSGSSLAAMGKPLPWKRALELGLSLARGLSAAHRQGIAHGEVRCANAFVADDGTVKLMDFGLSRALAQLPAATMQGDVVALGQMLFELCTGRLPSTEERLSTAGNAQMDPRFAALVDRCLEAGFEAGEPLREALERLALPVPLSPLPERPPYPGLRAFDAADASVFWGRGGEVRAVVDRLRAEPWVVVSGDSGVGKTSLVRAGILPAIEGGALGRVPRIASLVVETGPGTGPRRALARAITAVTGLAVSELEAGLNEGPRDLGRRLRKLCPEGLILVVDGLEQLVTLADPGEAELVGRALRALAFEAKALTLLGVVRTEALGPLAGMAVYGDVLGRALAPLRPLAASGLRDAIVSPAQARGFEFEGDALARLLASDAGLLSLQTVLSDLWDGRDEGTRRFTIAALDAVGPVEGAALRRVERVLAELGEGPRARARLLLAKLSSPHPARALVGEDVDAGIAFEALVRHRLVRARTMELGEPILFEAAHESLASAVAATMPSAPFAAAAQASLPGRKQGLKPRVLVNLAVGLGLLIALGIGKHFYDRAHARTVYRNVSAQSLGEARSLRTRATAAQTLAYARFDQGDRDAAETQWESALALFRGADSAFQQALDAERRIRGLLEAPKGDLVALIAERLALAHAFHQSAAETTLLAELRDEDVDGRELKRLARPAKVTLTTDPSEVPVRLERVEVQGTRRGFTPVRELGETPLTLSLEPGSYRLVLQAPGLITTRMPFRVEPGETLALDFPVLSARDVPEEFLYVPRSRFLYGSDDDESLRKYFFKADPLHEVVTDGFLIARTEVTLGEWIHFLNLLPDAERTLRTPQGHTQYNGVSLDPLGGGRWQLVLEPVHQHYVVNEGYPLRYPGRTQRPPQRWENLPVTGISLADGEAYAIWLDRTGRVPGARLCNEHEWEHAARGADTRKFPHGEGAEPGDLDEDVTYGHHANSMGPDEVGAHPASRSAYGVDDLVGNAGERTRAVGHPTQGVVRGGSWFTSSLANQIPHREEMEPWDRDPLVGIRICSTPRFRTRPATP